MNYLDKQLAIMLYILSDDRYKLYGVFIFTIVLI
jgi:hypothetical protein